jgi:hypothetical protein
MSNKPVYLLEDLRRWFKEKWTAQDGSPCGAYEGKGRVKCRPSKRVSSKTTKTWGEMSKKEKRKAVRLKQKAHRRGHQFSSHKTGKTWKGDKYKPGKKKTIKEAATKPSKAEMKQMMKYLKGSIDNPLRFYYLLIMSGMNGAKANSILFDLKNPYLRTSNTLYRKRMLELLKNIINTITKDQLLFNRVRSMALSGNLSLQEEDGGGGAAGGLSVGSGAIEGMPEGTPALETSGPIWGTEIPQRKKERKRRASMYKKFANLHRRNNAN